MEHEQLNNDKEQIFSAEHLKVGLKDRAVKSAGITIAAQGVKLVLQIGSMAIMARLLVPSDFGLIAMATVFTGLAMQLMQGGLSMATIQRDQITHAQVSNLFWVNVGLGIGLCMLGVLVAPLIANIYNEPRLTLVMAAMSLTFIIGGLSVQHDAILRRQMRFLAISLIDIASMVTGIIAGILSALNGLQYWALVISPVTTFLVRTVLRWISVRWLPSLMSRGSGVRPLLNFGANLTGANFVGYIASNVTAFTVGYIGGAQWLGFYNRANTLTSIPSSNLLPPVMNVMQSALTRVKDSPERLRRAALSLMSKIAIVTMFVSILMFVTADWLVLILLGDGWESAVTVVRILSISSIVTPITSFTAVIMVAIGEARALMRWKIITLFILLGSIIVGSFWGVMGVILAHCLSGLLIRMPGFLIYATRYQPVQVIDYMRALAPIFACAICTLLLVMAVRQFFSFNNPFLSTVVYGFITAIFYFLCSISVKSVRKEIMDGFSLIKSFRVR